MFDTFAAKFEIECRHHGRNVVTMDGSNSIVNFCRREHFFWKSNVTIARNIIYFYERCTKRLYPRFPERPFSVSPKSESHQIQTGDGPCFTHSCIVHTSFMRHSCVIHPSRSAQQRRTIDRRVGRKPYLGFPPFFDSLLPLYCKHRR